ncbi:hypothetical protein [Bathymodiolus thermophilus thioautotrophic gill symbiont]|uniref:Uncharacterized protein n=1 Tax=Bathymodiolus thermophilus thioautotrophic gill symbiont TaxID=2360 RepID=A0A1J5UHP8_9GAMM|nr:hypothetical protein [Bathymodiolus thermophilus thioautotrophic gill symbiont]OIR25421.1 hypothetical protein BGC33_06480 [Bathymodiolus thermophilus thioautotrophic gill symbiont]
MRYLYIILLFVVCTISINLHADVIECEIKEKIGTAKVLDITSDKFLQPVLNELEGYQIAPLKSCNVDHIVKALRKDPVFSSKTIFFLKEMTVTVNNLHSKLSNIYIETKNKESNNKYSEINLYVRSESENKYIHLLNAITDSSRIVKRYIHDETRNLKFESRYILLTWRFIDKDKKVNTSNIPKNILFFTYKGLPLPN